MQQKILCLTMCLLFLGLQAEPGNQQVKTKQTYEQYDRSRERYLKFYQRLCAVIAQEDAYLVEPNRAMIKQLVYILALFSNPDAQQRAQAAKSLNAKNEIPYFAGVATQHDLAMMMLEQAVRNNNHHGIQFIHKEYGIDMNTSTMSISSPLDWLDLRAGQGRPVETIRLLIKLGLDKRSINTTVDGQTVLYRAVAKFVSNYHAFKNPQEAFDAQCAKGAFTMPEHQSKDAEVAYYAAAKHEAMAAWRDAIKLLLALGADATITDKQGKSALEIFEGSGCMKEEDEICASVADLLKK